MLDFEIDGRELAKIGEELQATEKEIRYAFSRALRRTASTLRKESSKGLQSELGLRRAKLLRRRLKDFRIKRGKTMGEVKLWYGLNNLPVSEFKGQVSEASGGAQFRGKAGRHTIEGGFVRKKGGKGKKTILRRVKRTTYPVAETTLPINDKAAVFLEDEVFTELESIFWRAFRDDLTRRVAYLRG